MARKTELIQLRNANIKQKYRELCVKNPKWRDAAVIDEVSLLFFLTPRTITAILNDEGNYGKTG